MKWRHAPAINFIVRCPLCFIVSYVQPIAQHYESRTVQKAPLQSTHITSTERNNAVPQLYQCFHLKSEVSIKTLFSARYTAVLIKNCLKSNHSSHYEKYGRFPLQREATTCYHQIDNFHCQQRCVVPTIQYNSIVLYDKNVVNGTHS